MYQNSDETLNLRLFGEDAPVPDPADTGASENTGAEAAASAETEASAPAPLPENTEGAPLERDEPTEQIRAAHIAENFRLHFADLERQARALRETFPDFDLRAELRNPVFARMTAPGVGIAVEDAYYAIHRKEIHAAAMREASEKTAEKLASAIRAGSRRPNESGASAQAPSVSTFDYARADREQREAFKKDLLARMARGEKVYPRG